MSGKPRKETLAIVVALLVVAGVLGGRALLQQAGIVGTGVPEQIIEAELARAADEAAAARAAAETAEALARARAASAPSGVIETAEAHVGADSLLHALPDGSPDAGGTANDTALAADDSDKPEPGLATLRGTVLDPENEPVPEIGVTITGAMKFDGLVDRIVPSQNQEWARTDENGRFVVENLNPGTWTVSARPPSGFPYRMIDAAVVELQPDRVADVTLRLAGGDPLPGIVLNEAGEPVGDAHVLATTRSDVQEYRTDADGLFEIVGIPEGVGVTRLTVTHPDYLPETRSAISPLEGRQKFVLRESNELTLFAFWELDDTPVEFYHYRLSRYHVTGQYMLQRGMEGSVNDPSGRTLLIDLEPAKWRVEVSVRSPDSMEGELRAAMDFEVGTGEKQRVIEVPVTGGATLEGTVVLGPGGPPVEGAVVRFIPPSVGFGIYPTRSEFNYPDQRTDASGAFSYTGLPPGKYTLVAEKGQVRTLEAVDVIVPYGQDPEPATIVLKEGGSIFGVVYDRDREPVGSESLTIQIQRPNADGWDTGRTTTDSTGNYRFEGLPAGSHYVYAGGRSNTVDLAPGEEKEFDIDLSDNVVLTGRITLNGGTAGIADLGTLRFNQNGDLMDSARPGSDGTYRVELPPGTYTVSARGGSAQGVSVPFTVEPEPAEQSRDFDFELVPCEIVLVYPEEGQFEPGQAVVTPREQGRRYDFIRTHFRQENRVILDLLGGEYQVTFTSSDNEWWGEAEWQTVGADQENLFVIDVRKIAAGVRIGGWEPGQLSNSEFTTLVFNVSDIVESEGTLQVLVDYETGRHAVAVAGASIVGNGGVIDSDVHDGWSGADKFGNIYNLNLPRYAPGTGYEIRVDLRSDGGTDSAGSVYLSLN